MNEQGFPSYDWPETPCLVTETGGPSLEKAPRHTLRSQGLFHRSPSAPHLVMLLENLVVLEASDVLRLWGRQEYTSSAAWPGSSGMRSDRRDRLRELTSSPVAPFPALGSCVH